MNILFINDIPFNPIAGGLERVTDVLAKELSRRGYIIYYLYKRLTNSQLYLLSYDFPVQLYELPNYGLFENEENVAYYKYLQSHLKIDVVINQRGLCGMFNSFLPITQTKVISVIHSVPDADVLIFLSKLEDLSTPPCVAFKKFIKKLFRSWVTSYWRRKALVDLENKYNELVLYSDAIVMLTDGYIDEIKRLICVHSKSKFAAIPNPNTFNVLDVDLKEKENVVLYVGRLTKLEKEPLRMLRIWEYLGSKHKNWKLMIVGEGDEKNKMQEFVERRGLKNVIFEGRQYNVSQYYRIASFVCLTSNFEGWGMVLTEGMQYGCIPLTFNNYDAAHVIIDDGLNGCLIPAFNLKRYAMRLSELMSDENRRVEMSKAAIEKVKEFSVENIVDKWENLLNNL